MQNRKRKALHQTAICILLSLCARDTRAQVLFTSDLYQEIMHLDSIVFVRGYNECQLDELASVIAEDLEMYHDITGVSVGKDIFLQTMRQNICSPAPRKPIRMLIPGTVTIFPLYDHGEIYAVVQHGEHEFGSLQEGHPMIKTSKARFTHLWIRDVVKGWLLKRVISYDHRR